MEFWLASSSSLFSDPCSTTLCQKLKNQICRQIVPFLQVLSHEYLKCLCRIFETKWRNLKRPNGVITAVFGTSAVATGISYQVNIWEDLLPLQFSGEVLDVWHGQVLWLYCNYHKDTKYFSLPYEVVTTRHWRSGGRFPVSPFQQIHSERWRVCQVTVRFGNNVLL
jgi:hypothetical protein